MIDGPAPPESNFGQIYEHVTDGVRHVTWSTCFLATALSKPILHWVQMLLFSTSPSSQHII